MSGDQKNCWENCSKESERTTFVINEEGIIIAIHDKVKSRMHTEKFWNVNETWKF